VMVRVQLDFGPMTRFIQMGYYSDDDDLVVDPSSDDENDGTLGIKAITLTRSLELDLGPRLSLQRHPEVVIGHRDPRFPVCLKDVQRRSQHWR
jgi:hypothetical protein